MNILFLTTHLNAGGITTYLYTLTKGLIRKGHKVHIVSSGGNTESDFDSIGVKLFKIDIRTKFELSLKVFHAKCKLVKYIDENKIDIIHSNTRVTQVLGAMLKDKTKVGYVSTCHGYFKTRFFRKMFPCWGDRVIAISDAVAVHLKNDFNVNADRISLVKTGIDLEKFSVISKDQRMRNMKQYVLTDEPVIGIIARLSDVKGQDILISALPLIMEEIPDIKLILFGTGKFEGFLRSLVDRLGLKSNVIFSPEVNEVVKNLSVLDIFVAPSRQEGLGLSVMEAQASGLCVVASNTGGIPSLIEDGKTGFLFQTGNIEELAQVIIKLLKHPNRIKEVGSEARQFAEKNYSSEKMVEEMINVYGELIREKGKSVKK